MILVPLPGGSGLILVGRCSLTMAYHVLDEACIIVGTCFSTSAVLKQAPYTTKVTIYTILLRSLLNLRSYRRDI